MALTRVQYVFKDFINTIASHPWLYGSMIFFSLVGTAAALDQMQSIIDLLSHEEGHIFGGLVSTEMLREAAESAIEETSVELICKEFKYALDMCHQLNANFAAFGDPMNVFNYADGNLLGQSDNPPGMACNIVTMLGNILPQEILEACGEGVKETIQTLNVRS